MYKYRSTLNSSGSVGCTEESDGLSKSLTNVESSNMVWLVLLGKKMAILVVVSPQVLYIEAMLSMLLKFVGRTAANNNSLLFLSSSVIVVARSRIEGMFLW